MEEIIKLFSSQQYDYLLKQLNVIDLSMLAKKPEFLNKKDKIDDDIEISYYSFEADDNNFGE